MTIKHFLNKLLALIPGTKQSRIKMAAKKSMENFQKTLELLDKYDKGIEKPKRKGLAKPRHLRERL